MRPSLVLIAAATLACASPALCQVDRYGGVSTYPDPQAGAAAPPARVLTWPGKTIPAPAQTQGQPGGYGYPRYVQGQPAYGAQLQPAPYAQNRGAPPPPYMAQRRAAMYPSAPQAYYAPTPAQQPYQPSAASPQMRPGQPVAGQPYYAVQVPAAPQPTQGSTATAPSGVYPANAVPPQFAYPTVPVNQNALPMVGPAQPPTSIYAPAQPTQPQATASQPAAPTGVGDQAAPNPTDPRQPQRVAMNTAAPPAGGARLYSLHRDFGLQPDPTPAPQAAGQVVQLVSPIDSGPSPDPDADAPPRRTRQVTENGKTVTVPIRNADTDSSDN